MIEDNTLTFEGFDPQLLQTLALLSVIYLHTWKPTDTKSVIRSAVQSEAEGRKIDSYMLQIKRFLYPQKGQCSGQLFAQGVVFWMESMATPQIFTVCIYSKQMLSLWWLKWWKVEGMQIFITFQQCNQNLTNSSSSYKLQHMKCVTDRQKMKKAWQTVDTYCFK